MDCHEHNAEATKRDRSPTPILTLTSDGEVILDHVGASSQCQASCSALLPEVVSSESDGRENDGATTQRTQPSSSPIYIDLLDSDDDEHSPTSEGGGGCSSSSSSTSSDTTVSLGTTSDLPADACSLAVPPLPGASTGDGAVTSTSTVGDLIEPPGAQGLCKKPKGRPPSKKQRLTAEEKTECREKRKEATRMLNGATAKQDIFVCLDVALANPKAGDALLMALLTDFENVQTARLKLSHSVEWKQRKWVPATTAAEDSQASHDTQDTNTSKGKRKFMPQDLTATIAPVNCVAMVLPPEPVLQLIQKNSLVPYLTHILNDVHPGMRLVLICEGVHQYVQKAEDFAFQQRMREVAGAPSQPRKKKAPTPVMVSHEQLTSALAEARVALGGGLACLYEAKNRAATAQFLHDLTLYLAEAPHKKASLGSIRGRCARTAADAWPAMLMQIPKMTEEAVRAVTKSYPTMAALYRAYEDRSKTQNVKRDLLKGLRLAACAGPVASAARNIGPTLSQRVHTVFMDTNSDTIV